MLPKLQSKASLLSKLVAYKQQIRKGLVLYPNISEVT
jgi:hypothetical protein